MNLKNYKNYKKNNYKIIKIVLLSENAFNPFLRIKIRFFELTLISKLLTSDFDRETADREEGEKSNVAFLPHAFQRLKRFTRRRKGRVRRKERLCGDSEYAREREANIGEGKKNSETAATLRMGVRRGAPVGPRVRSHIKIVVRAQ